MMLRDYWELMMGLDAYFLFAGTWLALWSVNVNRSKAETMLENVALKALLERRTLELRAMATGTRNAVAEASRQMEVMRNDLYEANAALWRVMPNSHRVPCEINGFAAPDPFEGPGETYRAAYERLKAACGDPSPQQISSSEWSSVQEPDRREPRLAEATSILHELENSWAMEDVDACDSELGRRIREFLGVKS